MRPNTTDCTTAALCCVLLLCCSCGFFGGGLEGRATQYYNYMAGLQPKAVYSGYLSPAYKKQFERQGLTTLDESRRVKAASSGVKGAEKGDVAVAEEGRFGISIVNPQLGGVFAQHGPQRWVKVGSAWYLYTGSMAEIQEYGTFPDSLTAPPAAAFDERNKRETIQLKPRAGEQPAQEEGK
jgi:hypothetical protein